MPAGMIPAGMIVAGIPLAGILVGVGGHAAILRSRTDNRRTQRIAGSARLIGVIAATGAEAWTTEVPTLVQVPPVAADANLLVQPTDPAVACAADGSAAG